MGERQAHHQMQPPLQPTILEQSEPTSYEKLTRSQGGVQFNTNQLEELREISEPSENSDIDLQQAND